MSESIFIETLSQDKKIKNLLQKEKINHQDQALI